MRLNSFDGYYNIDFETFPDIYILGEWIAQNLPSIGFVEIICNTDEQRIFHAKNNKKFFCQLRIFDLIEYGKYMYEDIQARGLFYINNIDTDFMRKFFEDLAIFLDMNIYIPWDDIETEILDWTFFCSWCIGNKGKKRLFLMQKNLVILAKLVIWIAFLMSGLGCINLYSTVGCAQRTINLGCRCHCTSTIFPDTP